MTELVTTARPSERSAAGTVLRGLAAQFRAGARSSLIYRFDTAVGLIGMIIQIALTVTVWRTVYRGHELVAGVDQHTAVAYAVLAACFTQIVTPWQFSSIPLRIRMGQIGVDLTRPRGLLSQSLSQTVGTMAARLPAGLIGLAAGFLLGGIRPPASVGLGFAWLASMVLGVANVLLCNLAISMIAFWTTDISGPFMVYRFGAAFCSGALIPLWFMPSWLQGILGWLPFQAQMFAPLTIWFGTVGGVRLAETLALQAGWLVVIGLILRLIWVRAVRKVVVLGG